MYLHAEPLRSLQQVYFLPNVTGPVEYLKIYLYIYQLTFKQINLTMVSFLCDPSEE